MCEGERESVCVCLDEIRASMRVCVRERARVRVCLSLNEIRLYVCFLWASVPLSASSWTTKFAVCCNVLQCVAAYCGNEKVWCQYG